MDYISQVRVVHQIKADKDQGLLNKFTSHSHSVQISARANENLYHNDNTSACLLFSVKTAI